MPAKIEEDQLLDIIADVIHEFEIENNKFVECAVVIDGHTYTLDVDGRWFNG